MKKLWKKISSAACSAVLCAGLAGGTAFAAEAPDGMAAYREAIAAPVATDTRVIHESLMFFGPSAELDLDFNMHSPSPDKMRVKGVVALYFSDKNGDPQEFSVPFYLDQAAEHLALYFKLQDKWEKYEAPLLASNLTDTLLTPTAEQVKEQLSYVKSVKLLKETDTQRTMLVQVDGKKLYKYLKAQEAKTNPPVSKEEQKAIATGFEYLDQALQASQIQYTWTVDKRDWQTDTLAINFTDLLQKLVSTALNDPKANLAKEVREVLENVAFYGELRSYTTALNPQNINSIEIPEEVLAAEPFTLPAPETTPETNEAAQ